MSHSTQTQTLAPVNTGKTIQLISSAIFGLIILSVVAFAPLDIIHNAAHDARHSSGFPCH